MKLYSFVLAFACAAAMDAQTLNYSYDQAGRLVSVAYPSGKTLSYVYDASGNLLRREVRAPVAGPTPTASAAGIENAASAVVGPVSPGEIIAIYGTGIGTPTLTGYTLTPANFFDTLTGDTTVLFDGIAAPLIYTSAGQTAAVVPYAVAGQTTTQMVVVYQGRRSAPVTVQVAPSAPGLFSVNSSGTGNGSILNADASYNGPGNPAARGSEIVLYGTGEGQTTPPGVDGKIAPGAGPAPVLSVSVTIGGQPAEIKYAAGAPTLIAGMFQVNVIVPQNIGTGAIPVVLTVGAASSQAGLTVSVK